MCEGSREGNHHIYRERDTEKGGRRLNIERERKSEREKEREVEAERGRD